MRMYTSRHTMLHLLSVLARDNSSDYEQTTAARLVLKAAFNFLFAGEEHGVDIGEAQATLLVAGAELDVDDDFFMGGLHED